MQNGDGEQERADDLEGGGVHGEALLEEGEAGNERLLANPRDLQINQLAPSPRGRGARINMSEEKIRPVIWLLTEIVFLFTFIRPLYVPTFWRDRK
jgi:hypothetical protein